jgi:hypothetical protein
MRLCELDVKESSYKVSAYTMRAAYEWYCLGKSDIKGDLWGINRHAREYVRYRSATQTLNKVKKTCENTFLLGYTCFSHTRCMLSSKFLLC